MEIQLSPTMPTAKYSSASIDAKNIDTENRDTENNAPNFSQYLSAAQPAKTNKLSKQPVADDEISDLANTNTFALAETKAEINHQPINPLSAPDIAAFNLTLNQQDFKLSTQENTNEPNDLDAKILDSNTFSSLNNRTINNPKTTIAYGNHEIKGLASDKNNLDSVPLVEEQSLNNAFSIDKIFNRTHGLNTPPSVATNNLTSQTKRENITKKSTMLLARNAQQTELIAAKALQFATIQYALTRNKHVGDSQKLNAEAWAESLPATANNGGKLSVADSFSTLAYGGNYTSSSTALASAPLTAHYQTEEWQTQFQQQILRFNKSQLNHAELILHPADLGSIQVKIKIEANQAKFEFIAMHDSVGAVIKQALPELKHALSQQGIELTQSDIILDNQSMNNKPSLNSENPSLAQYTANTHEPSENSSSENPSNKQKQKVSLNNSNISTTLLTNIISDKLNNNNLTSKNNISIFI